MKKITLYTLVAILIFTKLSAQEKNSKFAGKRIEDNSFLIEEAYNQEDNVIQHISNFQYMKDKTWVYTFTEEWPVFSQKHQLSFTLPVMNINRTGLGDLLLNYRYQAVLKERTAFSPRFSFILPTGNYKLGFGNGVVGYQVNLPVSYLITPFLVSHYNLGSTFIPNAKAANGSRFNLTEINYGLSAIWLISENLNFMLEFAGNRSYTKTHNAHTLIENSIFLNPGIRYAINFKSGLQIVPGIAIPIGLGQSKGNNGIFGYLSFEHPL